MTFLQSLVARFMPTVMAGDDEIVDPQKVLRAKCGLQKKCVVFQEKLLTCNDRVTSRKQTTETCLEELIDLVSCVDHCVSHDLFSKLK